MRLCTVSSEVTGAFFGIDLGRKILRVAAALELLDVNAAERPLVSSMAAYLENLPKSEKVLRKVLQRLAEQPKALVGRMPADGLPALFASNELTFLPPIPRPGKVLCIGLNYKDHCEEQKAETPKKPLVFNKFATSLLGFGADIPLPTRRDEAIDWEGELAVVIGKRMKGVTKRSAMKGVAGYTIMNDVSARTLQAGEKQWARAKGFDGSAPCGPVVVTADEIPDPHALRLRTRVNGTVMQDQSTANMIFPIANLIAFITEMITLEPGDIIATGTPAGVGRWRTPPKYLHPGDHVEVEIDRIGKLTNRCVAG